ncbi:AprI/Inh family metalloprotease inhibitor [Pseudahrensia aquimaris]|uniref:AprI/Inh family metalloprotease inhibitor n=1 Tax=Pseudahrensia aquimaris TaxID=744461 RepID=A0ABW3FHI6_9HYPH
MVVSASTTDIKRASSHAKPTTWAALAALGLAVAMTGCTRTSDINQAGLFSSSSNQADPLPPTPTSRVQSGQLQPASPTPPPPPVQTAPPQTAVPAPQTAVPEAPSSSQPPDQLANVEPSPAPVQSSQPVTRQALIGRWTVSGGGSNCDIFLALTKWGSGFRAAGRQCGGVGIGNVSSWNVTNNQVLLYDDGGKQIASLRRTGEERYSGGGLTFSR